MIVPHGICPHSISTVYTVGDIPWGTNAYTVGNIECSPRYIITPNWHVTHSIYVCSPRYVPHGGSPRYVPHGIYYVPHGIYTLAIFTYIGNMGVYTVGNMGVPWGTFDICLLYTSDAADE